MIKLFTNQLIIKSATFFFNCQAYEILVSPQKGRKTVLEELADNFNSLINSGHLTHTHIYIIGSRCQSIFAENNDFETNLFFPYMPYCFHTIKSS